VPSFAAHQKQGDPPRPSWAIVAKAVEKYRIIRLFQQGHSASKLHCVDTLHFHIPDKSSGIINPNEFHMTLQSANFFCCTSIFAISKASDKLDLLVQSLRKVAVR